MARDATERETVDLDEAGRRLGLSRGLTYRLAKTGQLVDGVPVLKAGNDRYLVPAAALDRVLRGQAA
jgi:hypothetical protein